MTLARMSLAELGQLEGVVVFAVVASGDLLTVRLGERARVKRDDAAGRARDQGRAAATFERCALTDDRARPDLGHGVAVDLYVEHAVEHEEDRVFPLPSPR